jgi:putative flippase GtrA
MRALATRLVKYGMTGGVAAIVDAGGFELLLTMGLDILPASATSFCIAALVNYSLTSRFVFARGRTASGFGLFFAFALVGLTVNVGVTVAGVAWLGLLPLLAKIIGIGVAFLLNFALNAFVVFR